MSDESGRTGDVVIEVATHLSSKAHQSRMAQLPIIAVENTSILPNGEAGVTVLVSNATEAKMHPPTGEWNIEYENINPSPQITRKSMPPIWEWDSPQSEVTIEALLHAPEEESQGEYYYSVAVRNREEDTDDWIREDGVITLTESPNGR